MAHFLLEARQQAAASYCDSYSVDTEQTEEPSQSPGPSVPLSAQARPSSTHPALHPSFLGSSTHPVGHPPSCPPTHTHFAGVPRCRGIRLVSPLAEAHTSGLKSFPEFSTLQEAEAINVLEVC